MGYWQGAALGNALDAGRAEGKLNRQVQRNNQLVDRVEKDGQDAANWRGFQKRLQNDSNEAPEGTAIGWALFARTRSDLLPKTATLNEKRAKNLEIIAWAEFFIMRAYSNSNLSEQNGEKLGSLSELIDSGAFDSNKVSSVLKELSGKATAAASAVYDISPQEWVEHRFSELRKIAKFKQNEAIPVPESVQPTDPVLQNTISKKTSNGINMLVDTPIGIMDELIV